ncbi:SPOR domain-containing protein [Deltaproteobacteria bacterium OttesenSCG-928-K17]|nr:SPOR domain-containing protein [Deltaproteobacteria bacterium OttesenSCG-928-K17]
MLKNLFLAPGRFVLKFFSGDKRRAYRSARPRPTNSFGVGLVSAVCWLLIALGLLFAADKAGFLNKALDVGVEVASGDSQNGGAEDQPADEPEQEPVPDKPSATGVIGDGSSQPTAPAPTATPGATAGGNQAVTAEAPEMWLVILHSIPKSGRAEAERRQKQYKDKGLEVEILDTDAFPRLKPGSWIIALGPFDDRASALTVANRAKNFRSDLIVRRGL